MLPPDKLIFGYNLSTWPREKLVHARRHATQLEATCAAWLAGEPVLNELHPSVLKDRLNMVLRIRSQPPLTAMALILGDVLHALRSSLDSLAWELAHIDGAEPKSERGIYFPICSTEADWKQKAAALATWPEDALARVEILQPFKMDDPWLSPLAWLHDLNIQEKHRHSISAEIGGYRSDVEFVAELVADSKVEAHPTTKDVELIDGTDLGYISITPPARELRAGYAPIGIRLHTLVNDSRTPLFDLINALLIETDRALAITIGKLAPTSPGISVEFTPDPKGDGSGRPDDGSTDSP